MGSYIPSTYEERLAMLAEIGMKSEDDLFAALPESIKIKELNIPSGISEVEVSKKLRTLADKNVVYKSIFRGAGSYSHYIPSIVKTVTSKEEFLTAYTPYQAEISQGVLQSIFEYQTQICELTGMDVSNASVYDGAVAAAEAVFMCQDRKKKGVVVAGTADPQTIEVIKTYCESRDVEVKVVGGRSEDSCGNCGDIFSVDAEALANVLADDTACVYIQSPNYYGVIEDMDALVPMEKPGVYQNKKHIIADEEIAGLLLYSVLKAQDKKYLSWEGFVSSPLLYPFTIVDVNESDMVPLSFLEASRFDGTTVFSVAE